MLSWMCGIITRKDRVENRLVGGLLKVVEIRKKVMECSLIWFGHVRRREEGNVLQKAEEMELLGRKRRGRPRTRWKDAMKRDLKELGLLLEGDVYNRKKWRQDIQQRCGNPR